MHYFFDTFSAYQSAILALGSVAALGLVMMVASDFGKRRFPGLAKWGKRVFWCGMLGAFSVYAGIKPPMPRVSVDDGLTVHAWYTCETNIIEGVTNIVATDEVNFSWTYRLPVVPSDAFYIEKRQIGLTNSTDWTEIYAGTVADSPISLTVPNATNFEYFVYSAFTTPDVVQTNGVYHLQAVSPAPDLFVPLQSDIVGIGADGSSTNLTEVSLTPKRKEEIQ